VLSWIDDIFRYYDIDPSSPGRWEQAFWYLAPKAFPNFRLVNSIGTGAPKKTVKELSFCSSLKTIGHLSAARSTSTSSPIIPQHAMLQASKRSKG